MEEPRTHQGGRVQLAGCGSTTKSHPLIQAASAALVLPHSPNTFPKLLHIDVVVGSQICGSRSPPGHSARNGNFKLLKLAFHPRPSSASRSGLISNVALDSILLSSCHCSTVFKTHLQEMPKLQISFLGKAPKKRRISSLTGAEIASQYLCNLRLVHLKQLRLEVYWSHIYYLLTISQKKESKVDQT